MLLFGTESRNCSRVCAPEDHAGWGCPRGNRAGNLAGDPLETSYLDADAPVMPWVYAIARFKLIEAFRCRGRQIEIEIDDGKAVGLANPANVVEPVT